MLSHAQCDERRDVAALADTPRVLLRYRERHAESALILRLIRRAPLYRFAATRRASVTTNMKSARQRNASLTPLSLFAHGARSMRKRRTQTAIIQIIPPMQMRRMTGKENDASAKRGGVFLLHARRRVPLLSC